MCFAPQGRALFSTSQLPKVVQEWCVLYILAWKCPSRHNGVHFFDIATSKSWPRLKCFVKFYLLFAPQWRAIFCISSGLFSALRSLKSLEKHSSSRLSHLFAHLHLLSSDSFSSALLFYSFPFSVPLPCCAFHLSILSEVWRLNFLRQCSSGCQNTLKPHARSPKRLVQLKKLSSILKHDGEQKVLLYITQPHAKSKRSISMKSPDNHALQDHQL